MADWSRVRILLNGEPLLAREGEVLLGTRKLDMRRGLLTSAWTHRTPAGVTVERRELRLLSLADRAAGLQLVQLSLDRAGVAVRLEASFALAGLGMEPVRLEQDLGAWRTEGTRKAVAMTGAATLRLGSDLLAPDRTFPLRWAWRWRSVAEQVVEFDRLIRWHVPIRRRTIRPLASAALARSNALGWRAVLTAHEAAWDARWTASDILIDGDDESQRAVRFAVYHLTSAANPECDRVSIGERASPEMPISAMSFGYRNLPAPILYRGLARGGQGVADVPHPPGRARESSTFGFKGVLYAWESPTRAWRLLPSVCLFLTVRWWTF